MASTAIYEDLNPLGQLKKKCILIVVRGLNGQQYLSMMKFFGLSIKLW